MEMIRSILASQARRLLVLAIGHSLDAWHIDSSNQHASLEEDETDCCARRATG